MNVDGEWRTAFIADEAPKLNYGTAPVPVDDANPDLYGGGYTTGNIAGIPKRAEHPEQGWALLKYLATDDKAMVLLSNGLRNVPTTESSAKSPDLKPDPKFATFLKIYGEPEHDDDAGHRRRQRQPGAVQQLHQQVAGRARVRPRGRARRRRQADRRAARERRGQSRCRDRGTPASQEPREVAPPSHGPGVHEPLARRLHASSSAIRWSRRSTCRSRTTTCSSRRAGSGSPTTTTCSATTSRSGRRSATRCGWSCSRCR